MTDKIEKLKLVGIYHKNFMGLQAGEVTLTGKENVFIVSGKNEAGKSNFISTIPFGIGAQKIEEPVTKGMKTGKVTLHYEGDCKLEIEKRISAKSSPTLTIKVNGREITSPQTFLDRISNPVVLNPVDFHLKYDDKKRIEFLYEVSGKGKEIEKLDARHDTVYSIRKTTNQRIKELKGKLKGAPEDDGTKVKSINKLLSDLKKEQEKDTVKEEMQKEINLIAEQAKKKKARIAELKEEMEQIEADLAIMKPQYMELKEKLKEMPDGAVKEVQAKIDSLEETNDKARKIETANEHRKELDDNEIKSEDCTEKIGKIKEQKLDLLKDMPIDGLDIVDGDLTVNGVPWKQQSTAQGVLNALKIADMKNVPIRNIQIDWNHLDADSRKAVNDFAKEKNYFIIVELVSDEPTGDIFMEKGKMTVIK